MHGISNSIFKMNKHINSISLTRLPCLVRGDDITFTHGARDAKERNKIHARDPPLVVFDKVIMLYE
jgi:hypothetical protein